MDRAFRYMNGYTCLAGDCPDTCCASWRVPVDETHYELLRDAMSDPADRELFERNIEPEPQASRTPQRVARLKLDENRRCPFLDDAQLCSLHCRFGETLLPDACATFPRLVGLVGERRDLAGCLSCPEVARRALPCDDGTELVAAAPGALGRGALSLELRGGDDAARRLDMVRGAMYDLLGTRIYPLASRLFALAHFAHDLEELVASRGDPDALAEAIDPYVQPSHIGKMHGLLSSAPPEGAFGLGCVMQVFAGPLKSSHNRRFAEIAGEVVPSYVGATDVHDLWRLYRERRDALPEETRMRVDRLVFNYARHCCVAEWYSTFPGLRLYANALILRVATLRFLTIGHPAMAGREPDEVDDLGVEVFYSFSRAIERNAIATAGFLQIAGQALPTFAHTAPLLRV